MTSVKARTAAFFLGTSLLSAAGIALIKSHEGRRYVAYPDPGTGGAPWTICYGHTKGVYPGMVAEQNQCENWLAEDLADAEAVVQATAHVPLTQGEYDSYTSFVFNVGAGNWRKSTMLRLVNRGERIAACNQFPRWIYANKLELRGLKRRRFEEQRQCLSFGRIVYDPNQH